MQNKVNIIRQIKLKIYTLLSCHSEQSEESPLFVILSKAKNLLTHLLHPLERYVPSRTKRTWHKLPKLARRLVVLILILAIVTPFYLFGPWNRPTEAAWFDENWAYRQAIPVTSTEGSAQSNVFVSFTLDTATLITAGKMSSSCQDLRITDQGGKLLKYHIARVTACNNAATTVDFLLNSFPDGKSTYYVYYGNPSVSTADAGSLTVSAASSATVTASGNEITDATRTTNTQGDGVTPPDSSYGIWPAATNLVANGGFETNTTGWSAPTGSIAVSASQVKFGAQSLLNTPGGGSSQSRFEISLTSGTTYTASGWVRANTTQQTIALYFSDFIGGGNCCASTVTATTTGWSRVSTTWTATATKTWTLDFDGSGVSGGFYIDGIQVETGAIATPYIETNGGTAARSAGRIQASSSLINQTQGWFAARVKVGYPYNNGAAGPVAPAYFSWTDSGLGSVDNGIRIDYSGGFAGSPNRFEILRWMGVNVGNVEAGSVTFATGDYVTLVGTWTATQLKISVNGAAFVTGANTSIPSVVNNSLFDVGSFGQYTTTERRATGNVLWTSTGTGTLTDADATTLNGYGNTDPTTTQLAALNGGVAIPTFLWTADTTADTQTTYSQNAARNYTVGTLATEEKSPAPVAYWKFDEGTGTNAQDSSSNNLDGTVSDSTNWRTEDMCIAGKCLYFDGTNNDNVSKSDNAKLDFAAADNFTVSAWVKRGGASSANNFILTKAATGYTGYKLYQDASGDYCFDVSDGTNTDTACTSAVDFDDNNWHLVQGVKSATTSITLYVDGKQRAQDASIAATGTLANAGTFYAGVDLDGISNEWLGFLDDLKIYSYARSAAQVKADYASRGSTKGTSASLGGSSSWSGAIGSQPGALSNGLVGYWKMDEATANTCTGGVNDSCDSSGNSYDAAWAGDTASTIGKYGNGTIYDGTGDQTSVANTSNRIIPASATAFSMSLWFNPTTLAAAGLYGLSTNETYLTSGYRFAIDDGSAIGCGGSSGAGKPFFWSTQSGGSISLCSNSTVSTNTWNHIVVSYDGSSAKMFLNGVLVATDTSGTIVSNTNTIYLGGEIGGIDNFIGSIDETRIYNRALSGAEVSQLYNFAPGPVGYWNFEEGQGSTANDTSGNANTGTLTNSPAWTAGKYGKGISFNSNYVAVANESNFDFTSDFTVGFWISVDPGNSTSYRGLLAKFDGTASGWDIGVQSGKVRMTLRGTSNLDNTAGVGNSLGTNTWHHVVIVSTPTAIYTYNDGILTNTTTGTWTATTNNQPVWIGARSGTTGFTGKLDNVQIYNYARTAKQIVSDMNAGHPVGGSPVGSQVGYWKFDEGYGTTAYNSGSGSQTLQGTLSGPTWNTSGKFSKTLSFDGTNDVVTVPDNNALDFGTGEFSISFWGKSNVSPSRAYYAAGKLLNSGTYDGYHIGLTSSGYATFIWRTASTNYAATGTTDLTDNSWHHIVGLRNSSGIYVFVDGKQVGSNTNANTQTNEDGDQPFAIGGARSADTGELWNGLIDDVKVYNFALTSDEVKLDMNRGSSQVLGAAGDNSTYAINAANQEYCIPGDTTSCAAPVGRWDFEEKNGTTANDSSGNGRTGTVGRSSSWGSGKFGSAVTFDGSNDYVSIPTIDLSAGSTMSIEAWVKPTNITTNTHYEITRQDGGVNPDWLLAFQDNGTILSFGLNAGGTYSELDVSITASAYTDGKWHHIVGTYDGTTRRLYKDGLQIGSVADSGTIAFAGTTNCIGGYSDAACSAERFNGKIDQAQIFNYARTAAQVAWDYNRGGPVAYWKMDECQGSAAHDSADLAAGGSGNNGTITIGATGTQTSVGTCTTVDTATAWYNGRTGKYNSSLNFDGTDDYVSVPDNNSLDVGDIFTLSAWVKRGATGAVHQILNRGANGTFILAFIANDKLELGSHNVAAIVDSTTTITDTTTWHHLVATKNGSTVKLYIDGKDVTGTVTNSTTGNTTSALNIGRNSDVSQYFNGQIDDVRVYNYAVTASQVKMIYNQGSAVRFGPTTGSP